ncbi:hypothetical protein ACQ4M3_07630 [Leptolyngbya sp. AN03gr2]|uniref:hypothetical protein n=1 Tax=unclassified Leptolyngbya TaxID=2650499 RepID=UPI003D310B94
MESSLLPQQISLTNHRRNLASVPYTVLNNEGLSGVVSSGSDEHRVYISGINANNFTYYCATNNNRRCGGLRSGPCKHIQTLVRESCQIYSLEQIEQALKTPHSIRGSSSILNLASSEVKAGGSTFSQFLAALSSLNASPPIDPVAEMSWF